MKQRIRLTEEDLHRIIENSVRKVIMENDEDESWLGDKFRQGARAARSFMGQGLMVLLKTQLTLMNQPIIGKEGLMQPKVVGESKDV